MHPELFNLQLPHVLVNIFHVKKITLYTYVFLVAIGTLIASIYTKWSTKRCSECKFFQYIILFHCITDFGGSRKIK
jgi:prolipoprotein diacylglyceryltransferase